METREPLRLFLTYVEEPQSTQEVEQLDNNLSNKFQRFQENNILPSEYDKNTKAYYLSVDINLNVRDQKLKFEKLLENNKRMQSYTMNLYNDFKDCGSQVIELYNNSSKKYNENYFDKQVNRISESRKDFENHMRVFEEELFTLEEKKKTLILLEKCEQEIPLVVSSQESRQKLEEELIQRQIDLQNFNQRQMNILLSNKQRINELEIDINQNQEKIKKIEAETKTYENNLNEQIKKLKLIQDSSLSDPIESLRKQESIEKECDEENKKLKEQLKMKMQNISELKQILETSTKQVLDKIFQHVKSVDGVPQSQTQKGVSYHFIFLIDESGSILGHETLITQAYKSLIDVRKNLGRDKVSIIMFNSYGRVVCEMQPIQKEQTFTFNGGGTDFGNGFAKVEEAYQKTENLQQPVIIFLTDGDGSTDKACQILKRMYNQSIMKSMPLWTISVGFTPHFKEASLQEITKAGNGGVLQKEILGSKVDLLLKCQDIKNLVNAFQELGIRIDSLDNIEKFEQNLIQTKKRRLDILNQEEQAIQDEYLQNFDFLEKKKQKLIHLIQNQKDQNIEIQQKNAQKVQNQLEFVNNQIEIRQQKIKELSILLHSQMDELKILVANQQQQANSFNTQREKLEKAAKKDFENQVENLQKIQEDGYTVDLDRLNKSKVSSLNLLQNAPHLLEETRAQIYSNFDTIRKQMKDVESRLSIQKDQYDQEQLQQQIAIDFLESKDLKYKGVQFNGSSHLEKVVRYLISNLNDTRITPEVSEFQVRYFTRLELLLEKTDEVQKKEENKIFQQQLRKFMDDQMKKYEDDEQEIQIDEDKDLKDQIKFLKDQRIEERKNSTRFTKKRSSQYDLALVKLEIMVLEKEKEEQEEQENYKKVENIEKKIEKLKEKKEGLEENLVNQELVNLEQNIKETHQKIKYSYTVFHKQKYEQKMKELLFQEFGQLVRKSFPMFKFVEGISRSLENEKQKIRSITY